MPYPSLNKAIDSGVITPHGNNFPYLDPELTGWDRGRFPCCLAIDISCVEACLRVYAHMYVDVITKEEHMSELRVITDKDHPLGPRREGEGLFIAVAAEKVAQLASPDAKKLAYDARFDYGFENSGIEKVAGPIPLNKEGDVDASKREGNQTYAGWANIFKLTRGL